MAFKSKKWVKPGSVLPESAAVSTPNAPVAKPAIASNSGSNATATQRVAQPQVSRKWVKPGLVQPKAPIPCALDSNIPVIPASNESDDIVEATPVTQGASYVGSEGVDRNTLVSSTASASSLFPHLADGGVNGSEQAAEREGAGGQTEFSSEAAPPPPPPPPSYWKVVRAEAEAKTGAEGGINPSDATAGTSTRDLMTERATPVPAAE